MGKRRNKGIENERKIEKKMWRLGGNANTLPQRLLLWVLFMCCMLGVRLATEESTAKTVSMNVLLCC